MAFSTPFFTALGPLLFGRRRRSLIEQLLLQDQGQRSLSQYREAFGEFIPKTLLARKPTGEAETKTRARIFTPVITFWAFLAQVLERGSSCRHALRRIIAWWHFQDPKSAAPSEATTSYCNARARLEEGVLRQIGDHLSDRLEG